MPVEDIKKPSIAGHEISSLDADYPRNSLYVTEEQAEAKENTEKADLSSKPRIAKNTWGKQVSDGFKQVVDTILWPALKRTASDMMKRMVDVIIDPGRPVGRSGSNSDMYTPYNSLYSGNGVRFGGRFRPSNFLIEDFNTREEAASVLAWMRNQIRMNGRVSVGRLYDYIGESGSASSVDFNRCWTNLDDASIIRNGYKWALELPEPF